MLNRAVPIISATRISSVVKNNTGQKTAALGLRVEETVKVRNRDEILNTLDEDGKLDQLPFMPEMLKYCGQRFTVFRRIDKVNDTVERTGLRRMRNAVILDGVRCDGTYHGGCQAACQIIWKEAWLKRVQDDRGEKLARLESGCPINGRATEPVCSEADLLRTTRRSHPSQELFSCQATEVNKASSYLAWWDIRQDIRDIRSGNVKISEAIKSFLFWLFMLALKIGGYRALIAVYNSIQSCLGGKPYPFLQGRLKRTPTCELNLQPGEPVRVKSHKDILQTLDTNNKNRGLWFDVEMVRYCGGVYRVLDRVERLIDLKSGRMSTLPNRCIILEGVTTRGDYHRFYPQNEYPFWREIWLERV